MSLALDDRLDVSKEVISTSSSRDHADAFLARLSRASFPTGSWSSSRKARQEWTELDGATFQAAEILRCVILAGDIVEATGLR